MITLKTLPDATAQEVFDQVTTHLLTQMCKAAEDETCGECVYLTEDGLKCAAGCLIGPDEYDLKWDNETIIWRQLVDKGYVPHQHMYLISKLQNLHDMNHPDTWFDKLKYLAKESHLDFNPPQV